MIQLSEHSTGYTSDVFKSEYMPVASRVYRIHLHHTLFSVGSLLKKFKNCSDDIKVQLFRSYCTGMYTGQLWWNYSKCVIRKLIVAYNRAFRLLMGYPRDCSASGMFANNRLPSAQAILRNLCYKFIKRLEKSENNLIHNIRNSDIWFHSNIRKHWLSILYM